MDEILLAVSSSLCEVAPRHIDKGPAARRAGLGVGLSRHWAWLRRRRRRLGRPRDARDSPRGNITRFISAIQRSCNPHMTVRRAFRVGLRCRNTRRRVIHSRVPHLPELRPPSPLPAPPHVERCPPAPERLTQRPLSHRPRDRRRRHGHRLPRPRPPA